LDTRWTAGRFHAAFAILAGAALATAPALRAQDVEHAAEHSRAGHEEGPSFRHYVSLSGGASTHTERNETGGALGLSYGYAVSHNWGVGLKLEYASSRLERDYVALVGVGYEPVERLEFAVYAGVERVSEDEVGDGEETTVVEVEGIVRLTFGYAFPLSRRWTLVPEFNADISSSRVTYVYGVALSLGL
jgi:hypothetical protein